MLRIIGGTIIAVALLGTIRAEAQRPRSPGSHQVAGRVTALAGNQLQVTSKRNSTIRVHNFVVSGQTRLFTANGRPFAGALQPGMHVHVTFARAAAPNGAVVHMATMIQVR